MAAQVTKQEAIVCHTDLDQPHGHTKRGTAEPFLRLHSLYASPRCARRAALPRPSRRAVSQHSYPLNRFSSVPLDPMERPTSQADLELDFNPPRVQLSDEMFVFQDGRWVNETCRLQSPHVSPAPSFHHKLHHKRLAREHVLQEETRALREENRALREENRALRREHKVLQALWEEQEERRAASPGPEPVQPAPRGPQGSALQLLGEESRAPQQRPGRRRACWAQAEAQAAPAEGGKPAASPRDELLSGPGPGRPGPFEDLKGPADCAQEARSTLRALRHVLSSLAGPCAQEEPGTAGPGLGDGSQPWALLRDMNQALQALREENRLLREENRALHLLRAGHRLFQEEDTALWESSKLKLQQKLVIDTVTEVTARMEMLIEELYAFLPAKNKEPKKPSRV